MYGHPVTAGIRDGGLPHQRRCGILLCRVAPGARAYPIHVRKYGRPQGRGADPRQSAGEHPGDQRDRCSRRPPPLGCRGVLDAPVSRLWAHRDLDGGRDLRRPHDRDDVAGRFPDQACVVAVGHRQVPGERRRDHDVRAQPCHAAGLGRSARRNRPFQRQVRGAGGGTHPGQRHRRFLPPLRALRLPSERVHACLRTCRNVRCGDVRARWAEGTAGGQCRRGSAGIGPSCRACGPRSAGTQPGLRRHADRWSAGPGRRGDGSGAWAGSGAPRGPCADPGEVCDGRLFRPTGSHRGGSDR